MDVRRVQKTNVSNEIFEQLKQMLLNGIYRPGDKFPSENELTEAFGVSRMTARQAIQKLAVLGFLETRVGEGSYVQEANMGMFMNGIISAVYLGEDAILEILEFRTVVEGKTAQIAADKATGQDIADLEEIVGQMESCKDDEKRFSELDLMFHLKLAEITRNIILTSTYNIVNEAMRMAMEQIVHVTGHKDGLHYHKLILDAIKAHDGKAAKEHMTEHVEKTYQRMLEHRRKTGADV
ncbi:FadR family transcriptional regulator [Clostridiales bacterium F-3ap]|uniref:FadR family transcriptional regulator n=1 Tax=Anaerotalea alkaliphila TaxID=2662126 RepID=A0A7X5HV09_9FIRM|nr:FadR family transcriptional regulator [Anaerotalea alkaliphila]